MINTRTFHSARKYIMILSGRKFFLFHCCSFLKSYKLFRVTDFSLKQLLLECLFLFLLQFLQKYLFSAPDPEFLVLFIITAAFKILASNSSIFYIFFYSSAPLYSLPYASPLTPLHPQIQLSAHSSTASTVCRASHKMRFSPPPATPPAATHKRPLDTRLRIL